MKVLEITSIRELLLMKVVAGNQCLLARFLKINRGTLRKYKDDMNNERHVVIIQNGKYTFMNECTQGRK